MKLIIKRFLLIIIGIILSLIILECGLQFAGWTISCYQQYKNNKTLRNKSQYTVMCLGESTTQAQYPVQLQQILNERYPNKFSVIDCGLGSVNLETILDNLDNNIKKYNPDIAVCMMGVNNGLFSNIKNNNNISFVKYKNKRYFKFIELFYLIKYHINAVLKDNNLYAADQENIKQQLLEAINCIHAKNYRKSIKILKNILDKEPTNQAALTYLIINYFCDKNSSDDELKQCYDMILYAIDNNYYDYFSYFFHGFNYLISNNMPIDELKQRLLQKEQFIVDEKIYNLIVPFLTDLEKQALLDRKNIVNTKSSNLIKAIDDLHNNLDEKAEQYFYERNKILLEYPNTETYKLYKLIVKKLIDNNIKVICMQYPIISIEPLQNELKDTNYYNNIVFVSNEFNFKHILKNVNYWDLFRDQFAEDFGHCTDLGNTMIAENIVNTLEKILNLKE